MNHLLTCLAVLVALLLSACPDTPAEPTIAAESETTAEPGATPERTAAPTPAPESAEPAKGPLGTVRGQLDLAGQKANERLDRANAVGE